MQNQQTQAHNYNNLEEKGIRTGGIKIIKINTPMGEKKVWTKRIGNNPTKKLLLLHGGPGCTHEYLHSFESFMPEAGIQFYFYDQLGSYYSDRCQGEEFKPLWNIDRFVDEVEQVRVALGLDNTNFYLLGHSWGGILAAEYALKYQQHIKGLIISNMMMNGIKYNDYAKQVIGPTFPDGVLEQILEIESKDDFENPKYMELLMKHHYPFHVCRIPLDQWPDSVNKSFEHINQTLYVKIQGPSEFGVRGDLAEWNFEPNLPKLSIPTLFVGATHDTMDPKHMEQVSTQVQNGRFLLCPNGSHMSLWDDQEHYFPGVIQFINDVDEKKM